MEIHSTHYPPTCLPSPPLTAGAAVPASGHSARLGRFEVSGIQSVVNKYGESGKVSIHTRVDQGGAFHVEGAGEAEGKGRGGVKGAGVAAGKGSAHET